MWLWRGNQKALSSICQCWTQIPRNRTSADSEIKGAVETRLERVPLKSLLQQTPNDGSQRNIKTLLMMSQMPSRFSVFTRLLFKLPDPLLHDGWWEAATRHKRSTDSYIWRLFRRCRCSKLVKATQTALTLFNTVTKMWDFMAATADSLQQRWRSHEYGRVTGGRVDICYT